MSVVLTASNWRNYSYETMIAPPLSDELWGAGGRLHRIGLEISQHDPARLWSIADAIAVGAHDDSIRGGLRYIDRLMLKRILVKNHVIGDGERPVSTAMLTARIAHWLADNPQAVRAAVQMSQYMWRKQKREQKYRRFDQSDLTLVKNMPPLPDGGRRLVQPSLFDDVVKSLPPVPSTGMKEEDRAVETLNREC